MVVVVNFCPAGLKNSFSYPEKSRVFLEETVSRIAGEFQQHRFITISTTPVSVTAKNIENFVTAPISSGFFSAFRYISSLKKIVESKKAEFIIWESISFFANAIPSVIVRPEIQSLKTRNSRPLISLPLLVRRRLLKNINDSPSIICFSEFEKQQLTLLNQKQLKNIRVVPEGTNVNVVKTSFEEREKLKEQFASGKEYFLYYGAIGAGSNLLYMLKAFSSFKKRQRSSMQLIIAGHKDATYAEFEKTFENYKYRQEVSIVEVFSEEEKSRIVSGAYCVVFPAPDQDVQTLYLAMLSGVPSIAVASGTVSERGGDAVIPVEDGNFQSLATQMMSIFKDENLRSKLIERGLQTVASFSWNQVAKNFRACGIPEL